MNAVTREERGWAGHFILANRCRFRRNTLLTCGERRIVVSTVGALESHRGEGFNEIGYNRYYETMAFVAAFKDGYWDADVGRRVDFEGPWAIGEVNQVADGKANAMHEAAVAELAAKLAAGEPLEGENEDVGE